jgi:phage tail sheath protein FI
VISGPYTAKMTAISDGSDGATFALPSGDNVTTIKDLDENTVNPDDLVVGDRYFVTYTTPSLAVNVDWVLDADNGVLSIVPDTSHLVPGTTVTVSYTYVDASKVTQADIIGGEDGQGNFTGASCLIAARSTVLVQPRILIAPGFTSTKPDAATRNPVTDALNTIAIRLRAIAVVDTANTTKESAAAYAEDWGDSERVFCHYPFYKVLKADGSGDFKDTPASPYIAGLISKVDNDKGFWWSPSNNPINGILGLSKPIDFQLNDTNTVANYLNHHSVCTTISYLGLRLWGNHMTGEATENAPGMFINVRRTADMVEESILAAHLWAVDQNITKGYVEAVVEGVNAYLRTLKAQGAILGGKAWADPTLNTPDVLAQGHLYIDFDMTPPTPAEHLSFRAHLVNDYFADIFDTTNNGAAPIT